MGENIRKRIIPEPWCSIVDKVCLEDRKWFEEHPDELMRARPYIYGEFYPYFPDANIVVVLRGKAVQLLGIEIPFSETFGKSKETDVGMRLRCPLKLTVFIKPESSRENPGGEK